MCTEIYVQQYISFRLIVTPLDDGRDSWPKHVVVNKRTRKYEWCRVVREVTTDPYDWTFARYAAVRCGVYRK